MRLLAGQLLAAMGAFLLSMQAASIRVVPQKRGAAAVSPGGEELSLQVGKELSLRGAGDSSSAAASAASAAGAGRHGHFQELVELASQLQMANAERIYADAHFRHGGGSPVAVGAPTTLLEESAGARSGAGARVGAGGRRRGLGALLPLAPLPG